MNPSESQSNISAPQNMQKKIMLAVLLLANLFIVVGFLFLKSNQSTKTAPRAFEGFTQVTTEPIASPAEVRRVFSRNEKLDKLLEKGVEIITKNPSVFEIKTTTNGFSEKFVQADVKTTIAWRISDGEHILVFSDGYKSPVLKPGNILSRSFGATSSGKRISYFDENNSSFSGIIELR